MFLNRLSLVNFRNYRQLDLQLSAPVVLFQGDNGQGKTNLLEAVYFLATTRSLRAGSDRELIHFAALDEPIPFARVEGKVKKGKGELHVEIVLRADRPERHIPAMIEGGAPPVELSKRVKVNGVARRAFDLIGQINVVTFAPQDLELVAGSPSVRRRFLDILNCQVDHRYCRTLSQYNRVLTQRNHLLKQIRENRQPPDTLDYWTEELVKSGSYLLYRRQSTVAALNGRIDGSFHRLTATGKTLKVTYHSSVEGGAGVGARGSGDGARGDAETRREGESEGGVETQDSGLSTQDLAHHSGDEEAGVASQVELFRLALGRYRRKEVLQGASLVGPHRDDLSFRADGIDMNVYGSRGEQRAVALALKLSEVAFMQSATGEHPILLLDDVMSELDPSRRALLIEALDPACQTLITATDLESFSPEFLSRAALFRVEEGTASPINWVP